MGHKIAVKFCTLARNIAVTLFEKDTICLIRWKISGRALDATAALFHHFGVNCRANHNSQAFLRL
jgi:hypothetical protein